MALPNLTIDNRTGYRGHLIERKQLPDTVVLLTFSGGGTRAAALAQGVLRELDAIKINGGRSLLDEVDIISSVSGGSVAAANYVVNGRDSFAKFEHDFVRQDFMPDLIDAFVNPINVARYAITSESRIDRLVEIFKTRVFGKATYADLKRTRPLLLLNAADMTTSERFTFTQNQFDLICSDLDKFSIAEAVAASAAFPVGLTPIALKNHTPLPQAGPPTNASTRPGTSPCTSQTGERAINPEQSSGNWLHATGDHRDGIPRSDADALHVPTKADDLPTEIVARGHALREARLVRSSITKEQKDYVHLLDGGIADNLGLSVLTDGQLFRPGGVLYANLAKTKHLYIVVVNARADGDVERDLSPSPPGLIDMIWTSIGTAIDNRSSSMVDQLGPLTKQMDELNIKTHVSIVDFDRIRNSECRYNFAHTATNWGLNDHQIDGLMEMGSAMLRASPAIQDLATRAGGRIVSSDAGRYPGQLRAARACTRMNSGKAPETPSGDPIPIAFGNTE